MILHSLEARVLVFERDQNYVDFFTRRWRLYRLTTSTRDFYSGIARVFRRQRFRFQSIGITRVFF